MGALLTSYFRHIRGEEEGFPWTLLSPLGWLAGTCSRARNFSYDQGLSISREMPVPVISVGNITHGGTNKTPFGPGYSAGAYRLDVLEANRTPAEKSGSRLPPRKRT